MEWFGLEGTLKGPLVQPPAMGRDILWFCGEATGCEEASDGTGEDGLPLLDQMGGLSDAPAVTWRHRTALGLFHLGNLGLEVIFVDQNEWSH